MSELLLNTARQTLLLELQEASRLPERLGEAFLRAADAIIHCRGKVIVSGLVNPGILAKRLPPPSPAPAPLPSLSMRQKPCTAI
jgi:arabinose 5-phosphate isomerase